MTYSVSDLMSAKAVCRTAPATSGLSIFINLPNMDVINRQVVAGDVVQTPLSLNI